MMRLSTRDAAKRLGISYATLSKHIASRKVPPPEMVTVGRKIIHMWTEAEIEHVRKLLPKIANGRKTRYQRLRAAQKKGAQKQKAPAKKPVPGKRKRKNRSPNPASLTLRAK